MKQRVLITGASGFLGYHLIEEALKNDLEVYAAVRKTSDIDHLRSFGIQYVYLNYEDSGALRANIKENQYDYIIHAAGATRALTPKDYKTINADYTTNLALAAKEAGTIKGFVLISSLAAVGPLNTLQGAISETTAPLPITAYGKSKLLAENKLRTTSGLPYTILRPTAIYGPRDKDIFIFFKQIKMGIEPYIGTTAQKLSFIYVKDLAKVTLKAMFRCSQNTYNLSDGNFYDRQRLATITKNVLNLTTVKFHLPVIFVKLIARIAEIVGSLTKEPTVINSDKIKELTAVNWNCDIEKAKYDLGYYPLYDLDAGVAETLSWYNKHSWL